ncbi:MAG: TAXI family TRAP transporter solute-binding subunit [Rhodospirillales bacterium]|nr:TAXI family TRAP transporter solute-binding subunit [Rhodospirillales bacterium]MBO6787194.1 TAXI family TRAP transporter solute-binding subunit [Rhodospirillales bacterium]
MQRWLPTGLALALLCFSGTAPAPVQADDLRFFKIASGSRGGTYFPIASSLAKVISNPPGSKSCSNGGNCGIPDVTATAQSTAGSVANVDALLAKKFPSAIAQSDVTYWSYTGTGPFRTRKPNTLLCVITSLYPEDVHFVAAKGSNIKSMSDIPGRRIALGERNSGALLGAQLLVRAYGFKEGVDFSASFVNFLGAQDAMKAGNIDSFITVAGHPSSAIAEMMKSHGATLVPVDGKGADILTEKSPFYAKSTIPANVYPGQSGPVQTVAVNALWLARTDLDQNFIYKVTKAFWENRYARTILDGGHPKGKSITLSSSFDGVPIPLCVGAQNYYKEIGRLK